MSDEERKQRQEKIITELNALTTSYRKYIEEQRIFAEIMGLRAQYTLLKLKRWHSDFSQN